MPPFKKPKKSGNVIPQLRSDITDTQEVNHVTSEASDQHPPENVAARLPNAKEPSDITDISPLSRLQIEEDAAGRFVILDSRKVAGLEPKNAQRILRMRPSELQYIQKACAVSNFKHESDWLTVALLKAAEAEFAKERNK